VAPPQTPPGQLTALHLAGFREKGKERYKEEGAGYRDGKR